MPEKKKFTDRFSKTDIDAIRARDLDVILRIGQRVDERNGERRWRFDFGQSLCDGAENPNETFDK